MKKFNINDIKKYYDESDEIWPESDVWYAKTNKIIKKFLTKTNWSSDSYVLNAGSGGNNYDLPYNFHHVDISDNRMKNIVNFTKANIENLPFANCSFDHCICVGSVLNYCDALAALSELSRIIKYDGELILEFENSWSYRYKNTPNFGIAAGVTAVHFRGSEHIQWIYSGNYITSICSELGLKIIQKKCFHIISSLSLKISNNENKSSKYIFLDNLASRIPFIARHGNNIILRLKKV